MNPSDIQKFEARLSVAGEPYLVITLTRSGTINRMHLSEAGVPALSMGRTTENWFEQVIADFTPELLQEAGRYEIPITAGQPCELTVVLSNDSEETGFAFTYGSESMGPPEEIVDIVEKAMDLTEEWFETQQRRF
jgi:hypothetical protein